MTALLLLVPLTAFLAVVGLLLFIWTVRTGQYEDMDGAASRILFDTPPQSSTTSEKDNQNG